MAQNAAQKKALEAKAHKAETKSEGMRMLLDAGYTVAETKEVFGAPYGFVYGVAVRNGNVTPEAREAKPKAEKATAKAAPAKTAKAPAKAARSTAKAAPAAKKTTTTRRAAAKA